ncbi:hypothetical protein [Pseudogemmobacter faecipullorum]|uniref:Uncharacterized protein n=1 Tax=Pseudogemmobacter faecipullorum TaxID=2755041 RepID=A0ABS8CML3_9RHOB|nr:hypothetical protein [Pseudogemmobacter faecipullorum]MCB5410641.1 hypothetical protein [Pseudogemmobacter faecipullorum]
MSDPLPEFYFRIRENGASVFRIDSANRQRRMELIEIAMVNSRNGNIKAHGEHRLSAAEHAAIEAWLNGRRQILESRENEAARQCIEQLNLTAQWAQGRASTAQLEAVSDDLLLAMHDLRNVLVRKKAEALGES